VSLAVVGTGTEVGKTVVAAVLMARHGKRLGLTYWKPVATGSSEGRDTERVAQLSGGRVRDEVYLFPEPLSPHLAARLAGVRIDPARILAERADDGKLVVEGVGGLLVPLTDEGYLVADLLLEMRLACLLVALSTLGTINHTLLTLEALRSRGLGVAGVVLNGPPNAENRLAIERFGEVAVIAEVPRLDPLTAETLRAAASRLDPAGVLADCFR
jgi:dethiobiotin synthase